jgi:hypothetical protein
MIPWNFEWAWDIGHYIFFGLFYAAVAAIFVGLIVAVFMTVKHLKHPAGGAHEAAAEAEPTEPAPAESA